MITYIYTLSDPTTNIVKYVGKTINPKMRYRTYIKQAKNGTRNNLVINSKPTSIFHEYQYSISRFNLEIVFIPTYTR